MLRGIDISSWQPAINFQQVKAAGYDFIVIKVTGGKSYVNPFWKNQYYGAVAAGLQCGFYHYDGEPTVGTGTPEEEAHHFLDELSTIPHLPRECFLAYDCEERATRDPQRYFTFLEIVRKATGEIPFIYTYLNFVTELGSAPWEVVKNYPLWFAWYPHQIDPLGNPPPCPAPWNSYLAWQYSGGTDIPGIPNATDADAFYGSPQELSSDDPAVGPISPARHAEGFLEPVHDTFDWGGAGIIVERGILVYNDFDRKHYRRSWSAETGYTEWEVVN